MTISGFFGDEGALFFELALIDDEGVEMQMDGMLDTGFSYWLAVNNQDAIALNWVRLERQTLLTARGNFDFDIYAGKIMFDGEEHDIPVHVGRGLPEILLGRQWLETKPLFVNKPQRILTLG
ncbi:hypothetical protein RIVM261_045460 [Rivularia sp. IAM M-261]|nr:hypothetical protein CAL7716_086980 [Calothrix sp. PCC 7716]GJD19590.1 hypothetical protein RIVM261_045460 [Rivularia sp. IAM M-261]